MPNRCPILDCTNLLPRKIEANNDISGTGVLVGFVGTGYVVLLVLLIHYIIVYDPNFQNVQTQRPRSLLEPRFKPNQIDIKFLGSVRSRFRQVLKFAPDAWSAYILNLDFSTALRKSILNICDVQMITGLAILVSGFMVMDCGLSSYHWQIMVYLAWFSTVAHMSSLTSIRDYLSTRPWQRNIRFLITLVLLAMLITAIIPTAYFRWSSWDFPAAHREGILNKDELQALPAACFLRPTSAAWIWHFEYCPADDGFDSEIYPSSCTFQSSFLGNGPFQSAIFSITLLVFTFVTRTVKLFEPLSALTNRFLTRPISRLFHQSLLALPLPQGRVSNSAPAACQPSVRQKMIFRLVARPALALLLMLRLQVDLFSSMLSDLIWLMCILAWGTFKLLSSRNTLDASVLEEEVQWTYGQILPVLLLLMPVMGVVGTLAVDTKRKPAPEGNTDTDFTQIVHVTKGLFPRDSLDMTDDHESGAEMPPDWLVRNYYDTFWVNYCIICECGSIFAVIIYLFCAVFDIRDVKAVEGYVKGVATRFDLLEFWVTKTGGVYTLAAIPLACFTTFLGGFSLDKWLEEPGSSVGKHAVMFLLGGVIHMGYLLLAFGFSSRNLAQNRIASIACMAAGYCVLYTLIVVVRTVKHK